jgi:hypothetical protein
MMAQKSIKITCKRDGSISVEAIGYEGIECLAATKEIERLLGTIESKNKTNDYYKKPQLKAKHNA